LFGALAVAVFSTMANPSSAKASTLTFAQFSEADPGGNLFSYVDNVAGGNSQFGTSTGGPLGAPIPVNFTYLTMGGSLPADLTGNQAASLSMISTSATPVTSVPIPSLSITLGAQQFPTVQTNTISIIRNTPAAEGTGTRTNLLTVAFTGQLLGTLGGRTPQYSADTGLGFTVNYTSDFLTFNDQLEKDFSLTFSSWTNVGNGNGLALAASNFFASALASGAGTFDASVVPVPEPATWLLGAAGLLALFVVRKRFQQPALVKCPVKR
jgi:hypothetical protein